MSNKGLLMALTEIVRVATNCRDFWQRGSELSSNWGYLVSEISNPGKSEIGISKFRLIERIGDLAEYCEVSRAHSELAMELAGRGLISVGKGELADSDDLAYLEPWRDSLVSERSGWRPDQGADSTLPGFLGKDLRERGQELFTTVELGSTQKSDCLRTMGEATSFWIAIGMVRETAPVFEILTDILTTLEVLLRIVDDQPAWQLAIGAMEARLGGNNSQILGLESEIQSLRREKVIEWGGLVG